MINKQILREIGLTENETEIYMILLDKGDSTIYQIADHSKISRPNIYDIVKTLREKGLVSEIIKEGKKHFQAVSPENFLNILKLKEENFLEVLPELMKKYETNSKKPTIEIFQGVEGLKIIMNDMLKTKSQILIFNQIEDKKILDYLPDFYLERYFNETKRLKIGIKALYSYEKIPSKKINYQYKKLPREQLGNVGYWIYGDKVSIGIWTEHPLLIRVKDKEVANTFRSSFNLIWNSIK